MPPCRLGADSGYRWDLEMATLSVRSWLGLQVRLRNCHIVSLGIHVSLGLSGRSPFKPERALPSVWASHLTKGCSTSVCRQPCRGCSYCHLLLWPRCANIARKAASVSCLRMCAGAPEALDLLGLSRLAVCLLRARGVRRVAAGRELPQPTIQRFI